MAGTAASNARAPQAVEAFVKQLLVTHKAVRLYPAASHIPRENAAQVVSQVRSLLVTMPTVRLTITRDAFFHEGCAVLPVQAAFAAFAQEFYVHRLSDVRFHAGVTEDEVIGFLRVLQQDPSETAAYGDFEARLWEYHIDGITVTEVTTTVIDVRAQLDAESAEVWPPPTEEIDRLLDAVQSLRAGERRVLVRFVRDRAALAHFLATQTAERSEEEAVAWLAERLAAMAHVATEELAEEGPELSRSIAEAVMGIADAEQRRDLIERLLVDARLDDAVAEVVRQLDLDDVCDALAAGFTDDPAPNEGLARALKNLALVSLAGRDGVTVAARAALVAHGATESEAASLIESAMPTQIVERASRGGGDETIVAELHLVDLASAAQRGMLEDREVLALKDEARAGVSDADVLLTLVSVLEHERRPHEFDRVLEGAEDSLGVLIDWGEYRAAAQAAAGLDALAYDRTLTPEAKRRVASTLAAMGDASRLRQITTAMRLFQPDSSEFEDCRRLLTLLGAHAVGPLLDVLATEQDMASRKALVAIISAVAETQFDTVGARSNDQRWYVVRNVVSILGATRDSGALPHLARTLHHADERVRRETIRALAGINDHRATELLISALADADVQNVQLAARYLGRARTQTPVDALAQVAFGEGRGSREAAARIEAIEALGVLGGPRAEAVLADIAGKRALLGGGRQREIRAAAEHALLAARARRGGEERG